MIVANFSLLNLPLLDNKAINPAFFGTTVIHGEGGKTFWVNPAAVMQTVTVQPFPVVQDGLVVEFPPYTELISVQPPAKQVTIPGATDSLKSSYESVGVINPTGQIRLCALVRPDVIAAARHYNNAPYQPYVGMEVRFVGSLGTEVAKIERVIFTRDDFECYKLDRKIQVVAPAAIAPVESSISYAGRAVICFGLSDLTKPVATYTPLKYAFPNGAGWVATGTNRAGSAAVIERGDSGSPVFIISGGAPKYFGSFAAMNLTTFTVNMACPWVAEINSL